MFTLLGRVTGCRWCGDKSPDNNHVGAMVSEEREKHGYRSVSTEFRVMFI